MSESRTERIRILLDNYVDVEAQGLRDGMGQGGEHLPLMSRAWNHQSYAELDRLLGRMRDEVRSLYWQLSQVYFYAGTRRVLACANPRCEVTYPSWHDIAFHRHGHRHVQLVPKVVRTINPCVDRVQVSVAIGWLEGNWRGEVFLPDELVHLAA